MKDANTQPNEQPGIQVQGTLIIKDAQTGEIMVNQTDQRTSAGEENK